MYSIRSIPVLSAFLVLWGSNLESTAVTAQTLEARSIVFAGNTFVERMRLFGYFETFLHCRFQDQQLRVRHMGWPADEVGLRPRPTGFPAFLKDFTSHQPDQLFLFYGMNESFQEEGGLDGFKKDLASMLNQVKDHVSPDTKKMEILLVSPIAQEASDGFQLDLNRRNHWLRNYTHAMKKIAAQNEVRFIDLFEPSLQGMNESASPLWTLNGIHLNDYGDWRVSRILAEALNLVQAKDDSQVTLPATYQHLRRAIYEKNYSFGQYWRPPNMEYLYGTRNQLPGAEGMVEEQVQITDIIDQQERRIWRMHKPVAASIWQSYQKPSETLSLTPSYHGIRHPELGAVKTMGGDLHEGQGDMLTPDEAIQKFQLPPGYAIELFASEATHLVANPVAMEFDLDGHLWIANSPTWPHPIPGMPPQDSVVVLEDVDHDGKADRQTVFLDQLNMIHGMAIGDRGVYIAQTPDLIHARDTDGDGHADQIRTVLHGFGGEDVEHSINNFQWGPDGALYFMEGIFFHSQIETPYGPRRLKDGGVFRFHPKTHALDVHVSYAFWNPWGLVFNKWGDGIILDASSHDYFGLDLLSTRYHYPKSKRNKHRNLSFAPDGLGPAAGIHLLETSHFPDEAQGRFVANQLSGGFRGIVWYDIEDKGSSYEVKRISPDLLVSEDPFFRPLALKLGPDGALYVADFYSALIENTSQPKRRLGRDHRHGRIWRIRAQDRPLSHSPDFRKADKESLLRLLGSSESRNRHWARRLLLEKPSHEILNSLKNWIASLQQSTPLDERLLLEGLWLYQGMGKVESALLEQLLNATDWRVRAAAVRVLRYWQASIPEALEWLGVRVEDTHPRVRLQALLACGEMTSVEARNTALRVTKHSMDEGIHHVLEETMNYFDTLLNDE